MQSLVSRPLRPVDLVPVGSERRVAENMLLASVTGRVDEACYLSLTFDC